MQSSGGWTGRFLQRVSNPPTHLPVHCTYRICSDASMEGWGPCMDQCKIYGLWSWQEQFFYINILEMSAIRHALIQFNLPPVSVILVSSDNSTVEGGTRTVTLIEETYLLFHLLQRKQWFLRASYLLGARNVTADSVSRQNQILSSEWSLLPLTLYVFPVPDDQA